MRTSKINETKRWKKKANKEERILEATQLIKYYVHQIIHPVSPGEEGRECKPPKNQI